jgi:hypothetical protein
MESIDAAGTGMQQMQGSQTKAGAVAAESTDAAPALNEHIIVPGRVRPSSSRRLRMVKGLGHLKDLVKSGWEGAQHLIHTSQHRHQEVQQQEEQQEAVVQQQEAEGELEAGGNLSQESQSDANLRQQGSELGSLVPGGHSSSSQHSPVKVMVPCPFSAASLPLTEGEIGSDGRMVSIYLHESVANCMLWGLAQSQALAISIQDGTVPRLHLTTDLLAMLIPGLPKAYPHQLLRIDVEAIGAPPKVEFKEGDGTTVTVSVCARECI